MFRFLLGGMLFLWLLRNLWHYILLLKYFQLHEYDNFRFINWAVKNYLRYFWYSDVVLFISLVFLSLLREFVSVENAIAVFLFCLGITLPVDWLQYSWRKSKETQHLVYTSRANRLIIAGFLVYLFTSISLYNYLTSLKAYNEAYILGNVYIVLFGLWSIGLLTFVVIVIANIILFPIEHTLRFYYIQSARKILNKVNPFVIGITGSFGKTTTKEILAHLLETKYRVLKTPKSYNTVMGICKVIREELKPGHEYFVVEMGAYKRGEIARICDLVKPKIGILTAVGPQHLERFKTIENTAKAKFELIESLPPDGIAIFNADDSIVYGLSTRARTKVLRYGLGANDKRNIDLVAEEIEFDGYGTRFIIQKNNSTYPIKMRLLGKHNVSNTLAAVLAASECGLSMKEIIPSLAIMSPFEHRLQPIRMEKNITFIDDSYNSNPMGSKIALEVLASIPGNRRILVTPGMMELGDIEVQENASLGRNAAQVCDLIFLVGKKQRIHPILKGALEVNFSPDCIICCESMKEARKRLAEILQPGDVVLFENDLPDIY